MEFGVSAAALFLTFATFATAAATLPLPTADLRGQIRDLNTPRSMPVYRTRAEWDAHAKWLREHTLISCGLWPAPEKCPLNAKIFGRIERDGYSVEKVYFESWPGFYVGGNLYRPLGRGKGPFPAILNPHGHWKVGRLADEPIGSLPGRCIGFARQGYVAFSWDMIGYNDSFHFPHRDFPSAGGREWLWGLSLLGLQTWNSIRVVDFLQSLPDVDPNRIGCTGESGGGTQTFMVTAVEDRIRVAAPAVMVSAVMQGGCICENGPNLRQDTFNIEISARAAPRPQLLIAATGDWTRYALTGDFPAIRSIYRLLGAEDKVEAVRFDAPHNYNQASREAAYAFFGKWFLDDRDASHFKEAPFTAEPKENLLVWQGIEKPANALDTNGVTRMWIERSEKQLAAALADPKQLRALYEPALRHALALEVPGPKDVLCEDCGGGTFALGRPGRGDRVPGKLWLPKTKAAKRTATLVVHPKGWLAAEPFVTKLVERGQLVLAIDCFEHRRKSDDPFFTVYNKTDTQLRVQDIVTALAWLHSRKDVAAIDFVGLDDAGLWCLLARPFAPFVRKTVADAAQFNADSDTAWQKSLYVPVLRRAGDFRAALALIGDAPMLVHNTGSAFKCVSKARKEKASDDEIVGWLAER